MSNRGVQKVFITGSSSGLGRAAAKLFSSRGWKVIATMRNPAKETELGALPGVVLLALDITDRDQIETAVARALTGRRSLSERDQGAVLRAANVALSTRPGRRGRAHTHILSAAPICEECLEYW